LGGKSIPIHFVLDGGGGGQTPTADAASSGNTGESGGPAGARDSYVVVPGNTPFSELVHSVLARIGFTAVDALAAKGPFTRHTANRPATFVCIVHSTRTKLEFANSSVNNPVGVHLLTTERPSCAEVSVANQYASRFV